MDTKGSLANWKISLPESIALVATVVSVTLWAQSTFQSKDDAKEIKLQFENRLSKVESELVNLRNDISEVAKDTQFIRGKLEGANVKIEK